MTMNCIAATLLLTVLSCYPTAATTTASIDFTTIRMLAPKGRVQDRAYNPDLPIIAELIARGKPGVLLLIEKLTDETPLPDCHVAFWGDVRVGDIALIILTDFFTDSTWTRTTIPGVSWNDLLEVRDERRLPGRQRFDTYLRIHGRAGLRDKWLRIWKEWEPRVSWDPEEQCYKAGNREGTKTP